MNPNIFEKLYVYLVYLPVMISFPSNLIDQILSSRKASSFLSFLKYLTRKKIILFLEAFQSLTMLEYEVIRIAAK